MSNTTQKLLGAIFLKPQRVMNLSTREERARCEAARQCFDKRTWKMMSGFDAWMKETFANPKQVIGALSEVTLLFSDRAPV